MVIMGGAAVWVGMLSSFWIEAGWEYGRLEGCCHLAASLVGERNYNWSQSQGDGAFINKSHGPVGSLCLYHSISTGSYSNCLRKGESEITESYNLCYGL